MVSKSLISILIILSQFVCLLKGQSHLQEEPTPSIKKVIVKSAILPGWGQYSIEQNNAGKIFTLTEVGLFLFLAKNVLVSRTSEKKFKTLSAKHAGIIPAGKSNQYFIDMGNYKSMDVYNEQQQRLRSPENIYPRNEGFEWTWDSEKSRKKFRIFRIERDRAIKMVKFTLGGVALNHIVSVIDAVYLHRTKYGGGKLSLLPTVNVESTEFGFNLAYTF